MQISSIQTAPTLPTDEAPSAAEQGALARAAASSPEAVLMLASLDMEESRETSRRTRSAERQSRSAAQRAAIGRERKASRFALLGTVLKSAASMASASTEVVSDSQAGLRGALAGVGGALQVGGGVAAYAEADATSDAKGRSLVATEAGERAEDAQEHAQSLDRAAQKARENAATIARLQHETMMTAIRG